MLSSKIKILILISFIFAGFSQISEANQGIPTFKTWCPGGEHLESLGNGSFFVNGKPSKSFSKNESLYVLHNQLTFTVEQFSDGWQVTVSGRADASGLCSIEGVAAHITPEERAGQGKFDATGQIPCSRNIGQPIGQCSFGVARDRGGNASIRVEIDKGRYRFISFKNGKPIGADLSQADGDMRFSSKKEGDLFFIRAGKERFEIPEAVVFGG